MTHAVGTAGNLGLPGRGPISWEEDVYKRQHAHRSTFSFGIPAYLPNVKCSVLCHAIIYYR